MSAEAIEHRFGEERVGTTRVEGVQRSVMLASAVAVALLVVAAANSAAVFIAQGTWLLSLQEHLHFAIVLLCATAAFVQALRLKGPLESKLGQALVTATIVIALYALIILVGRLYFSRPILLATYGSTVVLSCGLVWLKHALGGPRVALIAPLAPGAPRDLPHTVVVRDPRTDLRSYDTALVTLQGAIPADWSQALSKAMLSGCRVRHVGEYVEELKGAVSLDHFEVDHLPPGGIASYRPVKRLMDIGLVLFFLPIALLIGAAGALVVLVTMGRPIFFTQQRVGLGGEPFRMWKLRTMRVARPGSAQIATVTGDNRITRSGAILRRFRIDELPQLWNVLRGDMSLIGPRPEQPGLTDEYVRALPVFAYRHLVRPGITGWAQVRAGYAANLEETRTKLQYDLYYVKKLSLFLDLQIMLRTFWTITAGSGVR